MQFTAHCLMTNIIPLHVNSLSVRYSFTLLVFLALLAPARATAQAPLTLWYTKPAGEWVEALPVGNGHIGGMVFGGVEKELIQLNESTLYSGGPVKRNVNPQAHTFLPQIRAALQITTTPWPMSSPEKCRGCIQSPTCPSAIS